MRRINRKTKPSICFVAHNAYGVLANIDTGHIGGIEVQVPLMANWFAKRGFDVSLVTWDEGDGYPDGQLFDGVKNLQICKRTDGYPILRFFYPRWTSLLAALDKADADIIYYNRGDLGLGQVVQWARKHARKVMYSVAAIVDCQRDLPSLKPYREKILYKYGLRRADKIVVQTLSQQNLLDSDFGLVSSIIPMPSEGFADMNKLAHCQSISEGRRILWVGRFQEEKRIEWLLDLAECCPAYCFDVVGSSNSDSEYAMRMTRRAEALNNVFLHGRVSHDELGAFYSSAHLLCSTSIYEGFPNVFLEAWSVGLPLVTTFDPDGVISNYKMGRVVDNVQSLANALIELEETFVWNSCAASALDYYNSRHSVDAVMEQFESEMLKLV